MRPRHTLLKLTFTVAATLIISGCQTISLPKVPNFATQPISGKAMPAAQLPAFNVGDMYYYSNGARDKIVSIEGDVITMLRRNKRKISNNRNFAIPAPYIEGLAKEYFKVTDSSANALWPLSVGKKTRFSVQGTSVSKTTQEPSTYTQRWACAVEGTERVRIRAGEFDTYRIKCQRFSSTNRWRQSRTWNYAPMLGTYVLRRDFIKNKGERIRELTAVRPSLQDVPKNVRNGIIRTWQTALETKKSGDLISWTDKATGTSVQVEPLNTYKAENGQFCRTYKQYLTRKGVTRIYSGVACRLDKLKWRTPRRT